MEPVVKFPLEKKLLDELIDKAKEYALMHGICMRRKDPYDRDSLHFAPFLLFPTPFPKKEFYKALEIQPLLNELMHKVAYDHEFLCQTLEKTIEVDPFTKRLFDIYEIVYKEGFNQPMSLGMIRSDLMLNTHPCEVGGSPFCCWKQVEINSIASGFGWLGPASGLIHRYVLAEMGRNDLLENLPENGALEGLAGAMIEAWDIYNVKKAIVLFIVEDISYNVCDQRFHEFEIRRQNPDVHVIRKTLTEVYNEGHLTEDKRLIVDGKEIAVIYFRCGYSPDQYHSEKEWDARLMMERSLAIKSPSIQYHLAGTKKVQQELADPEILARMLGGDQEKIEKVRGIFTGLYSLDMDEKGDETVKKALENPSRYVLKPQREGGGNNVYGDDIKPFLESIKDTKERNAYILMDKIKPPITTNYMVRPGLKEPLYEKCVSELGIFGYIIGDGEKIYTNKQVGHMLRTKLSHVNEGGVASGLGALDSVFLVDLERCTNCISSDCEC